MSERRDRDVFMSIDSPEDWYEGTDIFDIEQTIAGVQDYITQLEAEKEEAEIARDKYIDLYHVALSRERQLEAEREGAVKTFRRHTWNTT